MADSRRHAHLQTLERRLSALADRFTDAREHGAAAHLRDAATSLALASRALTPGADAGLPPTPSSTSEEQLEERERAAAQRRARAGASELYGPESVTGDPMSGSGPR